MSARTLYGRWQRTRAVLFFSVTASSVLVAPHLPGAASSDEPAQGERPSAVSHRVGHVIRVPLPITGEVDTRVKGMIDELLGRLGGAEQRPVLILEFRGSNRTGSVAGSQFERALALARYLTGPQIGRARTVAFLPASVEGHAVLPVLACEQIIAHPDAELGRAGIDEQHIDPTLRRGYSEIAERRRTIPVPVVLGMLDAEPAVYQVQTLDGARFVLEAELEELKKHAAVSSVDKLIPEGDLGSFTGSQLRALGFASHLARDRAELASALGLPSGGIEEDPTLGVGRRALRIDLTGPIKADTVAWIERGVREKIEQDRDNFVFLTIDSPGGAPQESVRLALYLANLDPGQVRTVAFVQSEARSDAALIALACDQLIVAESAVLGGPGARRISERRLDALRGPIRQMAEAKGRGWSLPLAMVDPELVVHRCRQPGTGAVRYFCTEERAEQPDADLWQPRAEWDLRSGISGQEAVQAGLAKFAAKDFEEIRHWYDLEGPLDSVQPNWAHVAIEFLASPKVAGALLFIGWFALMIEFMSPGLGLAGFTSAVCFLLFFWANVLHGTAGWLEVLLFAAGVVCVAMEIFVIPGLGAFGIGGGLLIVASIVLATQTFIVPRNAYEWSRLPTSLYMVVAAGGGALVSLVFMRRMLTEAPVFRRVALDAPEEDRLDDIRYHEALVHWDHLLGKQGVTTTQLTPSGKARFGDDLVDVISDGDVIPPGADVRVARVAGNEVLVRRV